MASLTETAYHTRRGIKFGVIGIVLFIFIQTGLGYLYELWLALHPPPPPPPTVAFGILPKINFPESTSSASLVYSLETLNGRFPDLPTIGKAYFIAVPKENLQSISRATEHASKLRFVNEPQVITETLRQWTNTENPLLNLRYNVATGNFVVKYDWSNDATIFNSRELPDKDTAILESKNFFINLGILPKELQNGKTQVSFYRASVGNYVYAPSLSSADFVRIDYFRDDLDNIPLVGDTPSNSPLFIIYSGTKDEFRRMVEVHYVIWDIQKDTFATYPLRTVEEAWNDLKAGDAYVASLGVSGSNLVNVRQIYLAYYYSDNPTSFLQPVYIFEGDKGFIAYVSAVSRDWLKTTASLPPF